MADNNKEKQQNDDSKLQIVVAVIALLGTLGAAIVGNWDKIFSKPTGSPVSESTASTPSVVTSPSSTASQTSGSFDVSAIAGEGFRFLTL